LTIMGIIETYCILTFEPKGNESVAKKMASQSR